MFFPTSVKTRAQEPQTFKKSSLAATASAKHVCVLDCQSEFNCCLLGLNIISSGSRATVVLQNKTKWATQVFYSSLQNRDQVCDNCRVLHPRSISSKPPLARLITHLFPSSPCLFFYFFISFFFFFTPKLLMKGADGLFCGWCQLHWVLCQIIYTSFLPSNATRLWSRACAYTLDCNTCQKTGSVQNMPLLRFQLKRISE